jgi:hypothetical protein
MTGSSPAGPPEPEKVVDKPGGLWSDRAMYARRKTQAIAAHRTIGGVSPRALQLTRNLLLAGALLVLLLRMGAGAG